MEAEQIGWLDGVGPYRGDQQRWTPGDFTVSVSDGEVLMTGQCPNLYEGGPRVAHGGWVAAQMDELLGCASNQTTLSVTGTLEIVYHLPVPVTEELRCTARVVSEEGRRRIVTGEICLSSTGALLASAKGTFVLPRPGHYQRQQEWLAAQGG